MSRNNGETAVRVAGSTTVVRVVLLATAVGLALGVLAGIVATRAATEPPTIAGTGYWHTSGARIVDAQGVPIRIAAVTWYGMESSFWVPAGLDYQPYTAILDLVKKLGYNAIRLPLSTELVQTNPLVRDKVAANPELRGRHALDVLDAIVGYAHQIGLKIILDNHRSRAARPKDVNRLDEPLWYTAAYPQSTWIHDWQMLARRYLGNDTVIGFDLRNEPHTNGPGPWTLHAYLSQGATWGPVRGLDNPATDWRLAAETAGNAVLAVNPHLLIFVEGVQLYPDSRQPSGVASYWWGGILTPVQRYPVRLRVPHQLVYSAHEWGPRKYVMPWFPHMTYRSLVSVWHERWAFLLDHPRSATAVPVWLGELGTCTNRAECVDSQRQGNQAQWFHFLLRYLQEHPEVGWSFFALDGTNSKNHVADNGLLNPHWNGVANAALQADLARIQR